LREFNSRFVCTYWRNLVKKLSQFVPLFALALASCADATDPDGDFEDTEDEVTVVSDDDLNGIYDVTIDGAPAEDAVIESWSAMGIRLTVNGKKYQLTRSGDHLSATGASLDVHVNGSSVRDDSVDGTLDGHTIELVRDTTVKPVQTLTFPGDRPFRAYLEDVITPAAQIDREGYKSYSSTKVGAFLRGCTLYKSGSWARKYMKGATTSEKFDNFNKLISAVSGLRTTPRRLTKEYKFYNTLGTLISDPSQTGLAMSSLGMYFSAGAGSSLRWQFAPDSQAYFITDKVSRAERIGVVAMDTPTHDTLASTFGRQLLDLGAISSADAPLYTQALMELLAKSDNKTIVKLSGVGQSAITDWYSVMAIEDYRGMTFGFPSLGWGYNMTNVQFFGLLAQSLARPGQVDSAGKPVIGQVIVGSQLRPGEASYADVLNNGNDMQEYSDMARLKQLATKFLNEKHADKIAAVKAAFSGIVPDSALDSRARADIFHYICAQLYDTAGRSKNLRGAKADQAIAAVTDLFATIRSDSAALEAYILANGISKSSDPAPKSTGF
jgi:hypothetical protein